MVSGVCWGMGVLDGGGDRRRGMGSFGGEFVASHCNQWGLYCIVVREWRSLPKLLWEGLVVVVELQLTSDLLCKSECYIGFYGGWRPKVWPAESNTTFGPLLFIVPGVVGGEDELPSFSRPRLELGVQETMERTGNCKVHHDYVTLSYRERPN